MSGDAYGGYAHFNARDANTACGGDHPRTAPCQVCAEIHANLEDVKRNPTGRPVGALEPASAARRRQRDAQRKRERRG